MVLNGGLASDHERGGKEVSSDFVALDCRVVGAWCGVGRIFVGRWSLSCRFHDSWTVGGGLARVFWSLFLCIGWFMCSQSVVSGGF